MPNSIPRPTWIYRIVHEQNVNHILRHGLFTRDEAIQDPNYVFIGDKKLTDDRHEYPIPIEGYGSLGDYVPFYFGQRSPMLYRIKEGYGVPKRPQHEIVYICCKLELIQQAGLRFVFTNGQAKNRLTDFFVDVNELHQIDWETVKARDWSNTEQDLDRRRRKQAELLVYKRVTPNLISAIIVYNEEKRNFVIDLLAQIGINIPVYINPKGEFYY